LLYLTDQEVTNAVPAGKAAETAMIKKKKREQFNMGYVFGAHFSRKFGYRVEGDDRVTLDNDDSNLDVYQIQKDWESLGRKTKYGVGVVSSTERRSVRAQRPAQRGGD
jgi:hypothetical protein